MLKPLNVERCLSAPIYYNESARISRIVRRLKGDVAIKSEIEDEMKRVPRTDNISQRLRTYPDLRKTFFLPIFSISLFLRTAKFILIKLIVESIYVIIFRNNCKFFLYECNLMYATSAKGKYNRHINH